MKHILCIDTGGTALKYNIMTTEGEILNESKSVATPKSKEAFIKTIETLIDTSSQKIAGVTFSMPGFINSETGYIARGGSLQYLDQTYFYDMFSHLKLPISIENDGRSFAIAEGAVGAAQGCKDYICLTIGTGIGAGIVVNGELLKGSRFCGGEYGLSYVAFDGKPKMHHDTCSMKSLLKMYKAALHIPLEQKVEGHEIFENADNPIVSELLATWYRNIAIAIFNLAVTFNPETILLGGGVSAQPDLIANITAAFSEFDTYNFWENDFNAKLVPCKYRNDAGFIGAFYHFKTMHPELF